MTVIETEIERDRDFLVVVVRGGMGAFKQLIQLRLFMLSYPIQ